MMFRGRVALFAVALLPGAAMPMSGAADEREVARLEQAVTANPEDLRVCAEYRQRIIASGDYDRAIRVLERLSIRTPSGPNVHVSLALAYVDKVPAVSPFRRIFLGRDALRAVSQAIALQPSLVAYYIRGLVELFYPEPLFHRARAGIDDLERARGLLATLPDQPYHSRVYVSLGDGYWKVKDLGRAVSVWTNGLNRFPANPALRRRLTNRGVDLDRIVGQALDPNARVDTSLQELFATAPAP